MMSIYFALWQLQGSPEGNNAGQICQVPVDIMASKPQSQNNGEPHGTENVTCIESEFMHWVIQGGLASKNTSMISKLI